MPRNMVNSQNNGFSLKLPKTFVPKEIEEKYYEILQRLPTPYKTALDYLNSTIQSITFPSISMDNVQQTYKYGKEIDRKSSQVFDDLFDKELTITFKSTDGYLNYWIIYDIICNYIDWSIDSQYLGDLNISNINYDGYMYAVIVMKQIIFESLSSNEWNFTETTPSLKNFDLTLKYNRISIETIPNKFKGC